MNWVKFHIVANLVLATINLFFTSYGFAIFHSTIALGFIFLLEDEEENGPQS